MSVYDAIHKRHQKFVMNQQISCSASFCSLMAHSTSSSSPGLLFASNIRAKLGVPVVSHQSNDASSFWLLASFSRSDFRLTPESVSSALQFVLGGDA